ncbi:hypothetical protein OsI_21665 [Oryza sativa Indica Group]|uniref:Uncharacterized protein n=1 Tax=Oryza sativa subsp. indica TaxID=39946 RepID=B8B2Q0_ORYSI|nr:hypothetical protein OsI_21665 [Oryza sativa Indica Group]
MTSVRRHGRRRNTHPARTTAATTIDDDDDNDLTTMSSESEDDGDRRISRLRLPPVTARVAPQPGGAKGAMPRHGRPSLRLRCPASVTKLAMAKCRWKMKNARRRRDGSEPWTSTRRRYDTSSTGLRPPPLAAILTHNAIAIAGEESLGAAAVAALVNLDRLELDLRHNAPCSRKRSAVAMANLYKRDYSSRSLLLQFRYKLDFDKSVDLFVHRSSKPKLSLDDDDEEEEEVSDIAVLSGQSFECLQSTLKRVSLQFRMEIEDQLLWIAACQLLRRKRHGS